jgi:hypothetical protein
MSEVVAEDYNGYRIEPGEVGDKRSHKVREWRKDMETSCRAKFMNE